jgi:hypothetical protein
MASSKQRHAKRGVLGRGEKIALLGDHQGLVTPSGHGMHSPPTLSFRGDRCMHVNSWKLIREMCKASKPFFFSFYDFFSYLKNKKTHKEKKKKKIDERALFALPLPFLPFPCPLPRE